MALCCMWRVCMTDGPLTEPFLLLYQCASSAQQCKIYMARNRPVMFKGAAKEWPAAGKWTLDFFSQDAMGDTKVTVSLDGKVCSFPIILPVLPARHQHSADKLRWPCRCSSLAA